MSTPKFLHLTPSPPWHSDTNGKIRIQIRSIGHYRQFLPGEDSYYHGKPAATLITTQDNCFYVEETPEEIDKLLEFVENVAF